VGRLGGKHAAQRGSLGGLRVRMVDLEHGESAEPGHAVRARVEARAEDDELLGMLVERGLDRVVDEAGARDHRRVHAGPPPVDEARHEGAERRTRPEPGHEPEGPAEEGPREGILEQPPARGLRGFQGAEQRVLLGGAAGSAFAHGASGVEYATSRAGGSCPPARPTRRLPRRPFVLQGRDRAMHGNGPSIHQGGRASRRDFLTIAGLASATTLLSVGPAVRRALAAALTKAQRDQMTPDDVIAAMKRGNERFRLGQESPHDYLAQQRASAKGQYPAAVILSCIDSRAPAETIMDLGIGDCFNTRVAGNIANDDILGSMEFACKVAGAKVALVMGHTACGAIKGAIDQAKLGKLTGLLTKIRPAVNATQYSGERSAKNYEFVDAVARKNVEMTVADIRRRSAVLADLEKSGALRIAGAMYDLETAQVTFLG
jgi:carbonic anhydrase